MSGPRYFPYADGVGILRTALRPLAEADWIEPGADLAERLVTKAELLAARRDDVLRWVAGSEDAQSEVLSMLAEHLPRCHPTLYARAGDTIELTLAGVPALRVDVVRPQSPALASAGSLVAEDLCILEPRGDAYELAAAVLCAPSYWLLGEKIGRSLGDVHVPVPGYAPELAARVARLFTSLRVDKPVWRANWSITNSPKLFQPSRDEPDDQASGAVSEANAGTAAYVRVERQTLRRLPRTGAVLFTIKVYVDPLERLRVHPEMARALADAVGALSPAEIEYKGMQSMREPVLRYLAAIGTGAAAIVLLVAPEAHAYVDPGAGSYFAQIVVAAIAGAALTVRTLWSRLRASLNRARRGRAIEESGDDDERSRRDAR